MAELFHNQRCEKLLQFSLSLGKTGDKTENWEKYKAELEQVTPGEVMYLVDTVMRDIPDIEIVKTIVSRMMNAFAKSLQAYTWDRPVNNLYIEQWYKNNQALDQALAQLRPLVKAINVKGKTRPEQKRINAELLSLLKAVKPLCLHYTDLENNLFPMIEAFIEEHSCVKLMWSIHDDIRNTLKSLTALIETANSPQHMMGNTSYIHLPIKELNELFGQLFFDIRGMIFREEYVLLPAMYHRMPDSVWPQLVQESLFHISSKGGESTPLGGHLETTTQETEASDTNLIQLLTGSLSTTQLLQIFRTLPVDITLIDAQDRVVFYSNPPNRIFPRTRAILGRKVQNCHPPESVGTVEKILQAFKEKRHTCADFRIHMQGRIITITYYALYNEAGVYDGTLEVSQDITALSNYEGEKRLLDWRD